MNIQVNDQVKINNNDLWEVQTDYGEEYVLVSDHLTVIEITKEFIIIEVKRNNLVLGKLRICLNFFEKDFVKIQTKESEKMTVKMSKKAIIKRSKIEIKKAVARSKKTFAQKKIAWNLEDPDDLYSKMDAYRLVKNFLPKLFLDTELAFTFNDVTHEQLISMLQNCADESGILYVPEDFSPFMGK